MSKFRQAVMLIVLIFIIVLILFSIHGAFLGADRAQAFFNSPPISVFWFILCLMLAAGLIIYRKLNKNFGLLFVHLGCILILAGAMYGSAAAHRIQKQLFKTDRMHRGQMLIGQGQETNQVLLSPDGLTGQLPFSIRLNEFRIEYYEPRHLQVQSSRGDIWNIPIEEDTRFDLGSQWGKVKIVRQFRNFRIFMDNNTRRIIDSNEPGYNPAVEVQIEYPNGDKINQYIFERFSGHFHPQNQLALAYTGMIRDYISDVSIIKNGEIIIRKNIEVNHPLHYGGYYFYQQSYDAQNGQYSILSVVSDSGLSIVYSGYLMLCGGVFWHFWFRHLFKPAGKRPDGN